MASTAQRVKDIKADGLLLSWLPQAVVPASLSFVKSLSTSYARTLRDVQGIRSHEGVYVSSGKHPSFVC
jgi:hypothetical protein